MENEWLEINYVGISRAFVTGHIADEVVEFELNDDMMEALYDFNEEHRLRERAFLKALYDENRKLV